MRRSQVQLLIVCAITAVLLGIGHAQGNSVTKVVPVSPAAPKASVALAPMAEPATTDQIREYLRLSGDMESFRVSWIAAVDKNRSIGAPYWPESFWTTLKEEMQKTNLMPMYITLFQHDIPRDLMQRVVDAYRLLGPDHFTGSPECIELGEATPSMKDDMDKLKLAKTLEVTNKVYSIYKPEIKAARARNLAEYPDWVDTYK